MFAAQSCAACLRLAVRRSTSIAAPTGSVAPVLAANAATKNDDENETAEQRNARVDRLLSKARALKVQHLRNASGSSGSGGSSSSAKRAAVGLSGSGSAGSKLEQYAQALKRRAQEAGFESVEELQQSLKAQAVQASVSSGSSSNNSFAAKEEELKERLRQRAAQREATAQEPSGENYDPTSPVKPLSAIMDLNKLLGVGTAEEGKVDAQKVAELWTTYHTLKNKLSAVIPLATYERLLKTAQRYPRFVVPLARDPAPVAVEGQDQAADEPQQGGHEMFYLEWATLPLPAPHFALASASTPSSPLPKPSTVLFTSLAEYKLRQEFAQPALVLTHYTDLAHSHGLVLMRGEISEQGGAAGASKMRDADAQQLCVTLQRFYLPALELEGQASAERAELVRVFHEEPEKFDVERLIKAATF
ncbi:hypothetical protein V8E36_002357 [Tilletia maclaganii]